MTARRRLRRLRFVTARYESLQGLRQVQTGVLRLLVALWGGLLFSPVGMRPATEGIVAILVTVPAVAALVGSLLLDQHLKRWYERTYGRVEPDLAVRRAERIGTALLLAGVVAVISLGLIEGDGARAL